ncbi:DNA polymerase III subunit chi [Aliikangiella coralliicola]|uniref:DNA polymerase III subunit chi n=1 Tax=Aliikangiella coralliicola TaxID=2592383 RepID=A0A545UAK6_9GAMM|nr:DNA polymerase III subunit chi [Aliikangiella coralliicola]TQV86463.1 DNA polymerase III subunit chi [Aliikangiella coralliicola]
MTQVEFYSVNSEEHQTPYKHLCEVIKRAYRKGQKVFVHANNRNQAEKIDELLWTQDKKSFLPHQLANEDPDTIPPIEIGFGQEPSVQPDVLINLAEQVPLFFSQFHWVFEYAYGDEESKEKARQRFRFYRERGYPLNHRKI